MVRNELLTYSFENRDTSTPYELFMTSVFSVVRETVCAAQECKKAGERQSTEAVTQNVLSSPAWN